MSSFDAASKNGGGSWFVIVLKGRIPRIRADFPEPVGAFRLMKMQKNIHDLFGKAFALFAAEIPHGAAVLYRAGSPWQAHRKKALHPPRASHKNARHRYGGVFAQNPKLCDLCLHNAPPVYRLSVPSGHPCRIAQDTHPHNTRRRGASGRLWVLPHAHAKSFSKALAVSITLQLLFCKIN